MSKTMNILQYVSKLDDTDSTFRRQYSYLPLDNLSVETVHRHYNSILFANLVRQFGHTADLVLKHAAIIFNCENDPLIVLTKMLQYRIGDITPDHTKPINVDTGLNITDTTGYETLIIDNQLFVSTSTQKLHLLQQYTVIETGETVSKTLAMKMPFCDHTLKICSFDASALALLRQSSLQHSVMTDSRFFGTESLIADMTAQGASASVIAALLNN
jgi:hypothetical protein